jgi:NTE family protein
MPRREAFVLGAGGHAASAWEIGLIAGMADSGLDLREAELLIGTSAGARVAVQLASGLPFDDLVQRQIDPDLQTSEAPPGIDWKQWRKEIARAKEGSSDPTEILRRIGAFALEGARGSSSERRQFIESQLPLRAWPQRKLLIVAVEAETGERRVFDRASGIELIDAVMASGAVAGIWPPVSFNGHSYIDGGFYSTDNADLAVGFDRVMILALKSGVPPVSVISLEAAVEALRTSGAQGEVVHPDEATEAVFASVGRNLLDPKVCEPAARTGRAQGQLVASKLLESLLR